MADCLDLRPAVWTEGSIGSPNAGPIVHQRRTEARAMLRQDNGTDEESFSFRDGRRKLALNSTVFQPRYAGFEGLGMEEYCSGMNTSSGSRCLTDGQNLERRVSRIALTPGYESRVHIVLRAERFRKVLPAHQRERRRDFAQRNHGTPSVQVRD